MMQIETRTARGKGAWSAVVAWTLLIFATIPVADAIRGAVSDTLGRNAFIYAVIAVCVIAAVGTLRVLAVLGRLGASRSAGIAAVLAAFVAATVSLRASPEEAVHFVEYGVLSALAYRALARGAPNLVAHGAAVFFSASVALVDEALQWLMPGRHWELRDVGLNLIAAALVQLGLAFAVTPDSHALRRMPDARSWRSLVRWSGMAVTLLVLSMLNTPQRIAWYTEKIPSLAFLVDSESAMFEYGYYYADDETGSFKSRLAPSVLAEADRSRGEEVGRILDRYRDPSMYSQSLRTYSPVSDPFVHEVLVHLFRRDRYIERAASYPEGSDEHQYRITVAYSEHKILQKYFPNTMKSSGWSLPERELAYLNEHVLPGSEHAQAVARSESAVSRNLVTAIREPQLMVIFLVVGLVLIALDRRLEKNLRAGGRT